MVVWETEGLVWSLEELLSIVKPQGMQIGAIIGLGLILLIRAGLRILVSKACRRTLHWKAPSSPHLIAAVFCCHPGLSATDVTKKVKSETTDAQRLEMG